MYTRPLQASALGYPSSSPIIDAFKTPVAPSLFEFAADVDATPEPLVDKGLQASIRNCTVAVGHTVLNSREPVSVPQDGAEGQIGLSSECILGNEAASEELQVPMNAVRFTVKDIWDITALSTAPVEPSMALGTFGTEVETINGIPAGPRRDPVSHLTGCVLKHIQRKGTIDTTSYVYGPELPGRGQSHPHPYGSHHGDGILENETSCGIPQLKSAFIQSVDPRQYLQLVRYDVTIDMEQQFREGEGPKPYVAETARFGVKDPTTIRRWWKSWQSKNSNTGEDDSTPDGSAAVGAADLTQLPNLLMDDQEAPGQVEDGGDSEPEEQQARIAEAPGSNVAREASIMTCRTPPQKYDQQFKASVVKYVLKQTHLSIRSHPDFVGAAEDWDLAAITVRRWWANRHIIVPHIDILDYRPQVDWTVHGGIQWNSDWNAHTWGQRRGA